MHEGVVLKIVEGRGFGFIGEAGQPDVFFNIADCIDLPWSPQLIGMRVTFEVISTPKGVKARNVRAAI